MRRLGNIIGLRGQSGEATVEYTVLIGGMASFVIFSLQLYSASLAASYCTSAYDFEEATGGADLGETDIGDDFMPDRDVFQYNKGCTSVDHRDPHHPMSG